ncbi:hypothetical protein WJX72_011198 [[Myrmecia] bisecta]|uniref:DNL-type domain-containing protein n=1 Tax=[Myrmecia] bisecta TaxID=41462 RepID=A0AAW1PKR9_9CHLO
MPEARAYRPPDTQAAYARSVIQVVGLSKLHYTTGVLLVLRLQGVRQLNWGSAHASAATMQRQRRPSRDPLCRMGDALGDITLLCAGHGKVLCYEAGSQLSDILKDATKIFGAGGFSFKKGERTYRAASSSRVPEGTYEWELYPPAAGKRKSPERAAAGGEAEGSRAAKRARGAEGTSGHGDSDDEETAPPRYCKLEGDEFKLPREKRATVADVVPEPLRSCFLVPGPWLRQITLVKLHIIAQLHCKVLDKAAWDAGGQPRADLVEKASLLVPVLWQVVKARIADDEWEPLAPFHNEGDATSNAVPALLRFVQRDDVVTELLTNWLPGARDTGRKQYVGGLSHETGMGKTMTLLILANPPMYLVDAFVEAVNEPVDMETMWTFLCMLQAVDAKEYANYFQPPSEQLSEALAPYWPTKCLMEELEAMVDCGSHLFVGLAGRSLGLALVGNNVSPIISSPLVAKVKVLTALSADSIRTILLETCLEASKVTLASKLGLADRPKRIKDFAERVFILSGGVALLVRTAIDGAVRCRAHWGTMSDDTWEQLLHERYLPEPGVSEGGAAADPFTPNAKRHWAALRAHITKERLKMEPADLTPKGGIAAFMLANPYELVEGGLRLIRRRSSWRTGSTSFCPVACCVPGPPAIPGRPRGQRQDRHATGELLVKVPGFSVQCTRSGEDKGDWAARIQTKLGGDPHAAFMHVSDFGTCLNMTNLFPKNVVGWPKAGSAGPDIILLAAEMWLLVSAKWRIDNSNKLDAADVAKDASYAMQMYESLPGGRPKRMVLLVNTYFQKTEQCGACAIGQDSAEAGALAGAHMELAVIAQLVGRVIVVCKAAQSDGPQGHADQFTCNKCDTRSAKAMSRNAYDKGVVLVRCPGCNGHHLIADNLGWFGDPANVEGFLKAKGEEYVRKNSETMEIFPEDIIGWSKVKEAPQSEKGGTG